MKSVRTSSLGVGVMAVPSRRERIGRLMERLGLDESSVAWDTHYEGHTPNWWRAVELASRGNPTHVLVLEDDAEPCRDFIPAVEKLITAYPDRIISFFSAKHDAVHDKQLHLAKHHGLGDVAVVYPREWLEDLRRDFDARQEELASTRWQAGYGADEMRMKLRPLQVSWNTVPSLVQHGCPAESTLGHTLAHSFARSCVGVHESALALDWSQI